MLPSLDEVRQQLGIGLHRFPRNPCKGLRSGTITLRFDIETKLRLERTHPTVQEFEQLRDWFAQRDWQLVIQRTPNPIDDSDYIYYLFLQRMDPVSLRVGYHATLRRQVDSILSNGLLPGSPDRRTDDDRIECHGNIYVCEKLGVPGDAGKPESFSAHWWRDHKSKRNRFNDPDWVILEIDLWKLPPHLSYRDIVSESGVILRGVSVIPPSLLRLVYP